MTQMIVALRIAAAAWPRPIVSVAMPDMFWDASEGAPASEWPDAADVAGERC